jgi:hypothetical protein
MRWSCEFGISVALLFVIDPVYLGMIFVTRHQEWRRQSFISCFFRHFF